MSKLKFSVNKVGNEICRLLCPVFSNLFVRKQKDPFDEKFDFILKHNIDTESNYYETKNFFLNSQKSH